MWIRQILVAVVGLASGFAVAAGLFSFIIGLGVVSDFADRTHTGKHVMLYENCIMAGGILGNIFWVYLQRKQTEKELHLYQKTRQILGRQQNKPENSLCQGLIR